MSWEQKELLRGNEKHFSSFLFLEGESPILNKDNMKAQCYIKIIKISISFWIDIQSSSLL